MTDLFKTLRFLALILPLAVVLLGISYNVVSAQYGDVRAIGAQAPTPELSTVLQELLSSADSIAKMMDPSAEVSLTALPEVTNDVCAKKECPSCSCPSCNGGCECKKAGAGCTPGFCCHNPF